MLFFLCQGGAALLIDFLCFAKPSLCNLSGVVEVVNPGKVVVIRHRVGLGPFRLFSDGTFILCLGRLIWHLRMLLLMRSDLESLVTLKVCCQVSLSGRKPKIVPHVNLFVGGLCLITKLGCLFEVFHSFCAFVGPDHRLFTLCSGVDHVRLCGLLRLRLGR